jgi:hypothetical protein
MTRLAQQPVPREVPVGESIAAIDPIERRVVPVRQHAVAYNAIKCRSRFWHIPRLKTRFIITAHPRNWITALSATVHNFAPFQPESQLDFAAPESL